MALVMKMNRCQLLGIAIVALTTAHADTMTAIAGADQIMRTVHGGSFQLLHKVDEMYY